MSLAAYVLYLSFFFSLEGKRLRNETQSLVLSSVCSYSIVGVSFKQKISVIAIV